MEELLTADEICAMKRTQLELSVAQLQYESAYRRANYRCDESEEAQEAVARALKVKEAIEKRQDDEDLCNCGLPRELSVEHQCSCTFYAT